MRTSGFAPAQRQHVVRTERGYRAFIPPPLPPEINFDTTLMAELSQADRSLGILSGIGETLPNPYLLAHAIVRREAVLSSRIEGTQASLSDLALFEVEPRRPTVPDVQEVANYVRAVEHVLDPARRLPVSLGLLREAHQILLTGVRGGYATPGEFRRTQNWIGSPGCVLDDASYIPPPPERMWECLDAFEKHIHAEHILPPLVVIAYLHYQFEAIHPFIDGNGRVGRLLVTLLLAEWNLLRHPLLDISAYFEANRDEYYARLLGVTLTADWTGWLRYFLNAIGDQAAAAARRARALHELRAEYRERVARSNPSALLLGVIDLIFESPAVNTVRIQHAIGISKRTAQQYIARLTEQGILAETTGRQRGRIHVAPGILRVLGEDG